MGKIHYNLKQGYWWRQTAKPQLSARPLPAQEKTTSDSEVLGILLRIMDKAQACADQADTGYKELAIAYEKAVMKEIADLTAPKDNTNG